MKDFLIDFILYSLGASILILIFSAIIQLLVSLKDAGDEIKKLHEDLDKN